MQESLPDRPNCSQPIIQTDISFCRSNNDVDSSSTVDETVQTPAKAWVPYVAPMALFMGMTALLEPNFKGQYVWLYILKVVVVTGALVACGKAWKSELRFDARVLLPAVLVGLAVFAEWIALGGFTLSFLGKRTELDPFAAVADPTQRGLFLAFRMFGLAVMVPLMEEVFWRSFLLRFLTKEDFKSVPMGTFSAGAFAIVALAFGFAHPEWLAAIVCAVAYGLLLKWTRSLFACVLAHAVTNLALGIYVLVTKQWQYW
jgi:uncharacterized protein